MKICYVLAYKAPDYIRTRSILAALRQIPDFDIYTATNRSPDSARYFETYRRTWEIKRSIAPDAYLLGFRGHEFYWPLRFLVGKKPIILDALMSPYASLARERKFGMLGAAVAGAWGTIERGILNDADLVLTDTDQHVRFYQREFQLPPDKLLAIPVGAYEPSRPTSQAHTTRTPAPGDPLRILFFGSFLPLHGINIILQAASHVRDLPLHFDFIGGNVKQAKELHANCARLGITQYTHKPWVPYDELINVTIPSADLCLGGPFGDTEQARRVITSKTSQCLALGKATVIGKIDEDIGLEDKTNCLLIPQGNPDALEEALRWACHQSYQLPKIGERGRSIYSEMLSVKIIRQRLTQALSVLSANS